MQQLRVILPNAQCNLHCKYCLDGYDNHNFCHKDQQVPENFDKLFEAAAPYSVDHISIWGGEPLLNPWLEPLLHSLREHYPHTNISFLSNGTLLTDSWVDKLNDLNIILSISHDGWTQAEYRNFDFLTESYIEKLRRLKTFGGYNCVVHKYNCDIPKVVDYFRDKLPQENSQLTFETFKLTDTRFINYLPSPNDIGKLYDSWVQVMQMAKEGDRILQHQLQLWKGSARSFSTRVKKTSCGSNNRLAVDLNGKIYHCQVASEIGYTGKIDNTIPHMCEPCAHARQCRGICPMIPERYRKKMCLSYHVYYDALDKVIGHEDPYESERERAQMPPELRSDD